MRTRFLALSLLVLPFLLQDPDAAQKKNPATAAKQTATLGKPAPTCRLNDETGKATTLGGKRENWTVLAFYPKAATPG